MNIVIAGASGGVGRDLTSLLDVEGNHLYLTRRRGDTIGTEHATSSVHTCDMVVESDVESTFSKFQDVDVFISCVGTTSDSTIVKMKEEQWDSVIDNTMKSTFLACKHVMPVMKDGGSIIIVSSAVARNGAFVACNYAAAKGGVEAFVRSFSMEAAKKNVRVNAIGMGFFNTGMGTRLPDKVKEMALTRITLKRFGEKEEMGPVLSFLVNCGYITGQTIYVDGGLR